MFKSFRPKLNLFLRKRAIALKRNFYTLPFVFVCLACFIYLASLYILIKSVGRMDFKPAAVFLFISILTSILSIVALVSYTRKVYGQPRPFKMLVIYYILTIICLGFAIAVFAFNEKQILSEIAKQKATSREYAEWYVFQTYINYGVCSRALFIIFFIFEIISNGLLIASPKLEKKLKSINFDSLNNEKKPEQIQ